MKGKKKVAAWIYGQLVTGRGLERGLDTLDKIGEIFNMSGYVILEAVAKAEQIESIIERKEIK